MLASIQKARTFNASLRHQDMRTPKVFSPPPGGAAYFGQSYTWVEVQKFDNWVYVGINAWMNEVAGGEPPNIGKIRPANERKKAIAKSLRRKGYIVNKGLGGPREHEEFEPYEHDHPLSQVFRNPNGPDVAFDLWAYTVLFYKLTGKAYWWVLRNDWGVPVEIWPVPSHWVRMVTGSNGIPVGYDVQSPWGFREFVPYDDMVTFTAQGPLNRYEGWAVTQAVGSWIDAYESLIRMRLAVWKNGAVPSLHIQLGEAYADPDEQFLGRFYSKWYQRFQGENRSGLPLITGADVEVKGIDGHRPADALAASNDSEEHMRDMILAALGVPKGVVGLEPLQDTSAYAPQRAFCRFSVNPFLTYVGQVCTEKIVKTTKGCEDGVMFWDNRVADDQEMIERQIAADAGTGSITPNEIRTIRGREPYPFGGDDPILNGAPVPWVTGKNEEDSEFAKAFQKSLDNKPDAEEDKGLSVRDAGQWLADKWAGLESRYGRKAALGMAVAMVVTLPIPGNLAGVIAAAEAIRGVHGFFTKEFDGDVEKVLAEGGGAAGGFLVEAQ